MDRAWCLTEGSAEVLPTRGPFTKRSADVTTTDARDGGTRHARNGTAEIPLSLSALAGGVTARVEPTVRRYGMVPGIDVSGSASPIMAARSECERKSRLKTTLSPARVRAG